MRLWYIRVRSRSLHPYTHTPTQSLRRGDMLCDALHLEVPALAVPSERFQPPIRWDLVKPGFDQPQQGAAFDLLQLEFDQRRRFLRIVHRRVGRVWMPPEGHQSLRFQPFDQYVKNDVFVAWKRDLSRHVPAGFKRLALERHAEPVAKLLGIR